jgi:hypothetical protein
MNYNGAAESRLLEYLQNSVDGQVCVNDKTRYAFIYNAGVLRYE